MKRVVKAVVFVFLISVVFYVIMSFIMMMVLFDGQYAEYRPEKYSLFLKYEDMSEKYTERIVSFKSGACTLSGRIYTAGEPEAVVILAHRKDGSGETMLSEASAFCDSGFASFVFDLTANGESEGTYQGGPTQPMRDVEAAVGFVKADSELSKKPILLYGQGAGGYGVCAALNVVDGISGVVSVSAYGNSYDMILDYGSNILGFFAYVEYPMAALYNSLLCGNDAKLDAVAGINASSVPVMVINASDDEILKTDNSALINSRAKFTNPNVTCILAEGKGHAAVMRSAEAIEVLNEYNRKAYELSNKYSGKTPVYEIEKLIEEADPKRVNELDRELIGAVIGFFKDCVSSN